MDPKTSIPPTLLIRRRGAKKWHIFRDQAGEHFGTMCGQHIRMPEEKVAYNAAEVDCRDCLTENVSRMLAERSTR